MNSIILNANVVTAPKMTQTKNGSWKAMFQVSTDGRDMLLHFSCVCFGATADIASELREGEEILISGRLVANTATRGVSLVVHALEILSSDEELEDEPQLEESDKEKQCHSQKL
jgi:single-stranded DNA-binding protein